METLSENKCFGGIQGVYSHASKGCCQTNANSSLFGQSGSSVIL